MQSICHIECLVRKSKTFLPPFDYTAVVWLKGLCVNITALPQPADSLSTNLYIQTFLPSLSSILSSVSPTPSLHFILFRFSLSFVKSNAKERVTHANLEQNHARFLQCCPLTKLKTFKIRFLFIAMKLK